MAHEQSAAITIHASAERVWKVLADVDAYRSWNPLIRSMRGPLAPRSRPRVRIVLAGWIPFVLWPLLLRVDPPRELRWSGWLLLPSLFRGEHVFLIEEAGPGSVRFTQRETYAGILAPLFLATVLRNAAGTFAEMNAALKRVAEGSPA